jgi:hypothetical protein
MRFSMISRWFSPVCAANCSARQTLRGNDFGEAVRGSHRKIVHVFFLLRYICISAGFDIYISHVHGINSAVVDISTIHVLETQDSGSRSVVSRLVSFHWDQGSGAHPLLGVSTRQLDSG